MPSPSEFRDGFHLSSVKDFEVGNFRLRTPARVEHVVVKTNRVYNFPTTLSLVGRLATKDRDKAESELLSKVKSRLCGESKIIMSEYGSPYECRFDPESFEVAAVSTTEGKACA